ncbi:Protein-N(5)-glutamine methyltransferase PrmC [Methylophaga frappieri]|uniref:Release factor glutamine methyltransferase n=1 Tax=Methylophaga frappieri (strain ATCC BAA-2434 / DSM 25690 / JAM7) TaxID=754477 RepID=I1YKF5_METFJ|nr:peptide chain release factor N(5)-glutamine methyltransferase [Methylophaga frappieri]AFJ03398.1 Protein-N(5)-glutamine methyltransferase PrmC [Methylophaga frappieri]
MSTPPQVMTRQSALQKAIEILGTQPIARQDAETLLCHVLGCTPTSLISHSESWLTESQWQQFQALLGQRQLGHPIAYLTQERGFWDMNLQVSPATLIPRPDTELLVAQALEKIPKNAFCADIGTGTGAIALAMAGERPDSYWLACDLYAATLQIAVANARRNQRDNVHFVQGDLANMLACESLDLCVSNPPYIADADPHLMQGDLRFEPRHALASGQDGLDAIRLLVQQAYRVLKPQGWLMIEHGWQQAAAVQALFRQAGFTEITACQDFGGQDRLVIGRKRRVDTVKSDS